MNPEWIVDGCPACQGDLAVPHTVVSDGVTAQGSYQCGACGFCWACSWLLSALGGWSAGDAA